MSVQPMRGQVYRVKLGAQDPKPHVVEIWKDEIEAGEHLDCLAPVTLLHLNDALAQALGLP